LSLEILDFWEVSKDFCVSNVGQKRIVIIVGSVTLNNSYGLACITRLEICICYVITGDNKKGAAMRRFGDTKISRIAKLNTVTVLIKARRQPA